MKYITTIGLEIHAELRTKSKMFCSCFNDSLEQHPNVNICPLCTGQPGTLPVANNEAIQKVLSVGLALNCNISEFSKFDRKNYFYPDLPKGYQISQYDIPFCKGGYLKIGDRDIRVTRVHLEEDTAKLLHTDKGESLVDFNRAGVPLMELVTEPDIQTAQEAKQFGQELQILLRYLGASDADMEKGQMRVEANVSIRPENASTLGTKVEVKNLNSFKAVERAIEFEVSRQTEVLEKGEKVTQETRGWDENRGVTFSQREKESAHEYRYFPEPDIPPSVFTKEDIEALKRQLPELPQSRKARLQREYSLIAQEADVLVSNKDLGNFFENVISELGENLERTDLEKKTKLSVNYVISDLLGLLNEASITEKDFLIDPENFAELIILISEGKISTPVAKTVLKEMLQTGKDPHHIIEDRGLEQVTDIAVIETAAKEVIEANPKAVEDFKKGKENALQFLVGQLIQKTRGKASPEIATQVLRGVLTGK